MSDTTLLKEIIEVAIDGADFYDCAQRHLWDEAALRPFAFMAVAKRDLIESLSCHLIMLGELPPKSGTSLGAFQLAYTDIRASLFFDHLRIYVTQFEEMEEKLRGLLDEAMNKTNNLQLRIELEVYLSHTHNFHAEMNNLRHKLLAA